MTAFLCAFCLLLSSAVVDCGEGTAMYVQSKMAEFPSIVEVIQLTDLADLVF